MGLDETIFFKSASLWLLDIAHMCFSDPTLQENIEFLMCSSIAGFYINFIQWKLVTGWNCNMWACYIEPQQRPLLWIWLVIASNTTSHNLCRALLGKTSNTILLTLSVKGGGGYPQFRNPFFAKIFVRKGWGVSPISVNLLKSKSGVLWSKRHNF